MNRTRITGIAIAVLGLLVALIPSVIFKVCPAMEMVMKCHWTGRVEVALGIASLILGALVAVSREKAFSAAASVASAINGVLVILVPTVVIGVCGSPDMNCNAATRPALIIAGAFIIAAGISDAVLYLKSKKD
ncbi:MAG: DUF4418 family protein [Clostridiales bacterium]|nr:DUF4418 family protein [Clostridiales bacterium]